MIELMFAFVCSNVTSPVASLGTPLSSLFLNTLSNYTVYIYGITNGVPCKEMKAFLERLSSEYGFKVVWVPLDRGVPQNATAVKVAESFGLPYVPIEGVYCNKKLVAVVVGDVENVTFWIQEVFKCTNFTRVYKGTKLVGIYKSGKVSFPFFVLVLAVIDSLNPIGLTIFVLFMMVCLNTKRRCWKEALEFVIAYASAHVALGALLSVLPTSPYYPIVGIVVSLTIIVAALKPNPKLRKLLSAASGYLSKLALRKESPPILGALAGTVGMSPCVLGSFLTASSAIGESGQLVLWTYYALIYAMTPILIAYALHLGRKVEPTKLIVSLATISFFVSLYMTLVNFGMLSLPVG